MSDLDKRTRDDLQSSVNNSLDNGVTNNLVPPWIRQVSAISWGLLGAVGAIAVLVTVLGTLRTFVIPMVIAGFLAVVFAPAVDWLAARRIPRALGAVLVLVTIIGLVGGSGFIVVKGIINQESALETEFEIVVQEVDKLLKDAHTTETVESILKSTTTSGSVIGQGMGTKAVTAIESTIGFATGVLLAAVMLYYLLKDGPSIVNGTAFGGETRSKKTIDVLNSAAGSMRSYMKGRTILALIQAALIGAASAVMGVPLVFAIALMNFIGGYIPLVGGLIGGGFAVLMALSAGGPSLALGMLAIVLFVSVGLEHVLQPKLLGDQSDLHPIIVLFAIVSGGLIVGIVGMLLAAPAVAIARMLWRELRGTGFFDSPNS